MISQEQVKRLLFCVVMSATVHFKLKEQICTIYVLLEIDLSSIYDGMIGFLHGSMSHLESSSGRFPLSPPLAPSNPPPLGCIVGRSLDGIGAWRQGSRPSLFKGE
jgi:hypothetical protein